MNREFDPVSYARGELSPLLRSLCEIAEAEEDSGQQAFFSRILEAIEHCGETADLAGPFMELSTAAFMGFRYSPITELLLDQALEKAQQLSESLSLDEDEVH